MKRIVIKVHVESDKRRKKALKIAAVTEGMQSLSLEGESRDEVVVTGEGVDAVCLTNRLRKKFHYATLLSVEDVKDSDEGGQDEGENIEDEPPSKPNSPCQCPPIYPLPYPTYPCIVYDPYPNSCSIL